MHGLVLLDKPAGITSNQALQRVRQVFQAQKAGHTGSLDKGATGLLPLCLGEATKLSAFLLEADKRYAVVCQLGSETSTGDAAGEITRQQAVPPLTTARLESVLAGFVGEMMQIPPMFSALKQHGQPLYRLAYAGKEVKRKARRIRIDEIVLEGRSADTLSLEIACSKGTYIRTLAEDIGRALGCGAHVKSLHRTASGPFSAAQMIRLGALEATAQRGLGQLDKHLLPVDALVAHMPSVNVQDSVSYYLCQGQAVLVPQAPGSGSGRGMVRLYAEHQRFLGIGEVLDDGRVAPRRLLHL